MIDWGIVVRAGLLAICTIAFLSVVATAKGREALATLALRALDALVRWFEGGLPQQSRAARHRERWTRR